MAADSYFILFENLRDEFYEYTLENLIKSQIKDFEILQKKSPNLLVQRIQNELKRKFRKQCLKIKEYECSDKCIPLLPAGFFENFPNLENIKLINNQIQAIDKNAFNGLANLQILELSHNLITTLPQAIFDTLISLKRLYLDQNQLQEITPAYFNRLASLELLSLCENNIEEIAPESFRDAKALYYLHFRKNRISSLHKDSFQGCINLKHLGLGSNLIAELPIDGFKALTGLKKLELDHNMITILPRLVFSNLGSLKGLDLSHNSICDLSFGFEELKCLENLDLSYNQIKQLYKDVFCDLKHLLSLDLGSNQIAIVEKGTFEALGNIEFLSLSENQITYLEVGCFDELFSLEVLELHGNLITKVAKEQFIYLNNLISLSLRENPIEELSSDSLPNTGQLSEIDVKIVDQQKNDLSFLKSLFKPLIGLKVCTVDSVPNVKIDIGFGMFIPRIFEGKLYCDKSHAPEYSLSLGMIPWQAFTDKQKRLADFNSDWETIYKFLNNCLKGIVVKQVKIFEGNLILLLFENGVELYLPQVSISEENSEEPLWELWDGCDKKICKAMPTGSFESSELINPKARSLKAVSQKPKIQKSNLYSQISNKERVESLFQPIIGSRVDHVLTSIGSMVQIGFRNQITPSKFFTSRWIFWLYETPWAVFQSDTSEMLSNDNEETSEIRVFFEKQIYGKTLVSVEVLDNDFALILRLDNAIEIQLYPNEHYQLEWGISDFRDEQIELWMLFDTHCNQSFTAMTNKTYEYDIYSDDE